MKRKKKEQYIAAIAGIILSVIMLLVTLSIKLNTIGGKLTGVFTIIFGIVGIVSFFNQNVAEVFAQWIKNITDNQERVEINQKQHKPANSPQTGVVHGDQHLHYGEGKKEESIKKETYNKDKIDKRLNEIKSTLNKLVNVSHKEGSTKLSILKKEVKGIIRRIYADDPEANEKRLIHKVFWIITNSTKEEEYRKWYLEDVNGLIDTIDVIIREMDLD